MVTTKFKVFALSPSQKEIIQRTKCIAKCRRMTAPIITNPIGQHRSSPVGDLFQGQIAAMMQPPATHPLTHRLGRLLAYSRCKTQEELSLAVLRGTWAKCIAQEIEALLRIGTSPICVLAVHDLRLLRMKGQTTLRETFYECVLQRPRLCFAFTVADNIVGVTSKGMPG